MTFWDDEFSNWVRLKTLTRHSRIECWQIRSRRDRSAPGGCSGKLHTNVCILAIHCWITLFDSSKLVSSQLSSGHVASIYVLIPQPKTPCASYYVFVIVSTSHRPGWLCDDTLWSLLTTMTTSFCSLLTSLNTRSSRKAEHIEKKFIFKWPLLVKKLFWCFFNDSYLHQVCFQYLIMFR